jgi:hypothetical protein
MLFLLWYSYHVCCREKDGIASRLEQSAADANANLAQIKDAVSSMAEELEKKRSEMKGALAISAHSGLSSSVTTSALATEIAPALQSDDHDPVETVAAAIALAQSDADRFKEWVIKPERVYRSDAPGSDLSMMSTSRGFFETYLEQGLRCGKICKMCDHKMDDEEWVRFEAKASTVGLKRYRQ